MKFIHIADLHLDTPLLALRNNRNLIKKRRAEHKQIFKEVIALAKEEKIDALFISGDFFEQKYIEKTTIDYIMSNFELIPEVKIFITPGNHDPLIKNSPYKTNQWPNNVVIFGQKIKKISMDDNIDIYGFGFEDYELTTNLLGSFQVEDSNKVNVLVTHGNIYGKSRYNDMNMKQLNQFDYVALGHIHLKKLDNNIVYPGSLVSCGFDELGEHGLVIGTLEKNHISYEFRNMEHRHFEIVELDISDARLPSDVLDKLTLQDNIYRIVLKGSKNLDVEELQEELYHSYENICEVRDETHLPYDLEKIATERNLRGIFTQKMLEHLKENPNNEQEVMKAIELTFRSL